MLFLLMILHLLLIFWQFVLCTFYCMQGFVGIASYAAPNISILFNFSVCFSSSFCASRAACFRFYFPPIHFSYIVLVAKILKY